MSNRAAVAAESEQIVEELRRVCRGHGTRALLVALTEMYARVVSDTINSEAEMEKALDMFTKNARGWWLADRGGQFHVS